VIDDKCVGCKFCIIVCFYGIMFYDFDSVKVYKCNFCGGVLVCVEMCSM